MTRSFTFVLVLVICIALLVGPVLAQDAVVWPTAEWPTSTPEEQGMDSAQLLAALDYADGFLFDSLAVIRNGQMVLDATWYPYTQDQVHELWSASKSFTTTLVEIAIEQGLIESLDQPILELLPEPTIAELDDGWESVRVRDLLAMTSGIECVNYGLDVMAEAVQSPDPLSVIFSQPVGVVGELLGYCDLNTYLLAHILSHVAGKPMLEYADEVLFGPLGITEYNWQTDASGVPLGAAYLQLKPHDLARLGYLYLNEGEWNGEPIVSPEWVDAATCADMPRCPYAPSSPDGAYYGFGWWVSPPSYMALGAGWQTIVVNPQKNLVIAFTTSGVTVDLTSLINGLLSRAAVSDEPLPANPEALAALNARIESLAHPQPQAVDPVPDSLLAVSGVDYQLEEPLSLSSDPRGLLEISLGWPLTVDGFRLTFGSPDEATLDLQFEDGYAVSLGVGLDGVPRVTDTRYGQVATTGRWVPQGRGLIATIQLVSEAQTAALTFRPRDGEMRVLWQDGVTGLMESTKAQPSGS